MGKQSYRITLQTPMGARYGTMSVNWADKMLNGMMDILNHKEPFKGTVEENGDCRITGRLVTLMRNIEFTAVGNISPEFVYLAVQGERNNFELYGRSIAEDSEEGEPYGI